MIPLLPLARAAGVLAATAAGAAALVRRRRPTDATASPEPAQAAGEPHGPTDNPITEPAPTANPADHPAGRSVEGPRHEPVPGDPDEPPGPWLDLFGRDLRRTDLSQFDLVCADLRRARLTGRRLDGRDLTGALLAGADLDRTGLRGAVLAGVDFAWASLRRADLRDADLTGASLIEADLKGADLSGADLSGARNLASAVLRGARASRSTTWPAHFDPALAGVELVR